MVFAVAAGCGGGQKAGTEPASKVTALSDALRPEFAAKALRKIGGAHFHSQARFGVGPVGGNPNMVTTATDVWIDRAGNYHFKEENDRDGGREVVLHGRELAVALRYGEMIRRIAEEPEPTRLLEEALGAPWAAFELIAARANVKRAGTELVGGAKSTVFELSLAEGGSKAGKLPAGTAPFVSLRSWRSTASIEKVQGRVVVDDASGALLKADLAATFSAKGDGGPVAGTVEVNTTLAEIASVPPIEKPMADELSMRQRTLPEQRELLRGLGQLRPASEPSPARSPRRP